MLKIHGLTQRYGSRTVLDGVDLVLEPGSLVALLGPNGAGKTTLFQVATGLFSPDAGTVEIGGLPLASRASAALGRLGVVFQQPSLDLDLTVVQNLRFHADLHGLPRAVAASRIAALAAVFGIAGDLDRRARELSGGNRRRVELARSLLHEPALLLLDEPTVGLDPASRRDLLARVREEVGRRGCAVLWATHLVDEAEQADRVLVLYRGRLLADGTPGSVAQALGGGTLAEAFLRATAPRKPSGPPGPPTKTQEETA